MRKIIISSGRTICERQGPRVIRKCRPYISPVAFLNGNLVSLTCIEVDEDDCTCREENERHSRVLGPVGTIYQVEILFRGLMEYCNYVGATVPFPSAPNFVVGGTAAGTANIYKLVISNQLGTEVVTYNLNQGTPDSAVHALNYTVTIPIPAGSTVQLVADSQDGIEVANNAQIFVDPEASHPPLIVNLRGQPLNMQWVQTNVLSLS